MTGRRAVIGLCMLCALLVSALAAQGASAAGLTAFTCKKGTGDTGAQFTKEHCKPSESGSGEYGHFKITENEVTHATLSNEKTDEKTEGRDISILKETIAATPLELKAKVVD